MVVFGGSYGIGADVVDLAERHGAQVFSFSRSQNGVRVEDAEAVEDALDGTAKETGRIDYVVNTAGVLHMGKLAEVDDVDHRRDRGRELPRPRSTSPGPPSPTSRETRGHLLLYTSSSYTRGRADYSLYSSTKAAVVNLTQALADEWADVRRPGQLRQPRAHRHPDAHRGFGEEPAHTLLSPRAVAQTSLDVLISDLTGQVIDVRLDAT